MDWERKFTELMPKLFHYFCYRTGDPSLSEELTQTTFLKAWESRESFDPGKAPFTHWVFGIASNVRLQHLRNSSRPEVNLREDLFASNGRTPEEALLLRDKYARLSEFLLGLPERERELISLKYGAGFTNREISAQTGLSESNVGTIIYRAMKTLRKEWG